jgi:flagellar secretion chaperone FliS
MPISARDNYLETEVLTATPQKLRLMLIEGAIHAAERTRHFWSAGDKDLAFDTMIRAQQIVTELMSSLNYENDNPLIKKLAAVYLFVFRTLVEANVKHDEKKLDEAIRVLEEERVTWRQVCEQAVAQDRSSAAFTPSAPHMPPPPVGLGMVFDNDDLPASPQGFSLDA